MVYPKLVLVLGAGASAPYGLFTGSQLAHVLWRLGDRHLLDHLPHTPEDQRPILKAADAAQKLLSTRFSAQTVADFAMAFERSRLASIDLFLQKCMDHGKQDFVALGRLAIAVALCRQESVNSLIQRRRHGACWFSLLWQYLVTDVVEPFEIANKRVTIVTFNYDRSFEELLYQSFSDTFHENNPAYVREWMKGVPVHHVYGQLGDHEQRPYQHNNSEAQIEAAADGIRLIHDRQSDLESDVIRRASIKIAVEDAEEIRFLGFSYQRENIEVLGLSADCKSQAILGTAVGLEQGEIDLAATRIESLTKKRLQPTNRPCDMALRFWGWRGQ